MITNCLLQEGSPDQDSFIKPSYQHIIITLRIRTAKVLSVRELRIRILYSIFDIRILSTRIINSSSVRIRNTTSSTAVPSSKTVCNSSD